MLNRNEEKGFLERFSNVIIFLVIILGLIFLAFMFRRTQKQQADYANWAASVNAGDILPSSEVLEGESEVPINSNESLDTQMSELPETLDSTTALETATPISPETAIGIYQKLAAGADVHILIVGDSIAAGHGATDSSTSWAILLQNYLQTTYQSDISITNISAYGNTVYNSLLNMIQLSDGIDYDLAIICHGENDPETQFALYYEALLQSIRSKYSQCAILSVLEGSQRGNSANVESIQTLCQTYSVPIADIMTPLSLDSTLSNDGIYPNDQGHQTYCNTIAAIIDSAVAQNQPYTSTEVMPVDERVSSFGQLQYYSVDSLTRSGDTSYTIYLSHVGAMSLDTSYAYTPASTVATIYADDANYTCTAPEYYEQPQHLIVPITDSMNVSYAVKIIFQTKEEADALQGILIH